MGEPITKQQREAMREDAASARHAFCRDDVLRLLDALEAAEAELRAIREEVRADPAAKTVDAVAALLASARCTVEEAQREAERLRHGVPIEGDLVCPNELRATEAEAERDEARAELAQIRPLAEEARVFVDLVESNWECDCDARHVAICRSCAATALMARFDEVRHG